MRTLLLRTILAGAIIALLSLALAPVAALAAPMNSSSHCGSADPQNAPITNSCLMHCQIIQCRVSSAVDSRAINMNGAQTGSLLPVCVNSPKTAETQAVCLKAVRPPQPDLDTSPYPDVIYQCRNSLSSEDPASL